MKILGVCSCGGRLDESQYCKDDFGNTFKSCPRCSNTSGHHVFYNIEEFGERNMGDGRIIAHSYCPSCRNYQGPSLIPAFECSDQ